MPVLRRIPCARPEHNGRCALYGVLENGHILYVIPPPNEGEPGFVGAASIGKLIRCVAATEGLDPEQCQHFVLFAGCDERFLGRAASFLFARVEFVASSELSYARLGAFFTNSPLPCPPELLLLCRDLLGEHPTQIAASSTGWVLPPRTS